GASFADLGNDVTCIDIDKGKIEALKSGRVPIYEPGLEELIHRNVEEGRLTFTTSLDDSVKDREVVFICVGTPQKSTGKADLTPIIEAVESVAKRMDSFLVIVTKSTVPPGTAERITRLVRELTNVDFEIVSNPEFLKEGAGVKDFP